MSEHGRLRRIQCRHRDVVGRDDFADRTRRSDHRMGKNIGGTRASRSTRLEMKRRKFCFRVSRRQRSAVPRLLAPRWQFVGTKYSLAPLSN